MTLRTPQVGDIITTAEELDTLPIGSAVLARGKDVWTHVPAGGCARWLGIELSEDDHYIEPRQRWLRDAASERGVVILYIPGRQPRPEREVKAEALREYARDIREAAGPDLRTSRLVDTADGIAVALDVRADRIERGDA